MANFVRNILAILLTLFFIGINVREISARRHSPLLIEDDGSRRNRPAGKFYFFIFIFVNLFVCLSIRWNLSQHKKIYNFGAFFAFWSHVFFSFISMKNYYNPDAYQQYNICIIPWEILSLLTFAIFKYILLFLDPPNLLPRHLYSEYKKL